MKKLGKLLFLISFLFALASLVYAKEVKKLALLIANDDYGKSMGKLSEPIKEALALKIALESIGFEVTMVKNANKSSMKRALKNFKDKNAGSIAFFHYGGHAISVGGKNYLIPLGTDVEDEDELEDECLSLDALMRSMQGSSNIVVLDSCRNNPFLTSTHRGATTRGLQAVVVQPQNSIIVYSAQPGNVAIDGVFTPILTKKIAQEGKSFSDILIEVRNEVMAKTQDKQRPGEYRELSSQIYLAGKPKNDGIYTSTSKPNVKTQLLRGTLEISTITPCSIFVEGHEVASLNAFGECSISCDVGMRDIEIRYEDKHVEKKNVMVKKEGISSIREEYVSKDVADKCYALGEEADKNNDKVGASRWYKLAADGGNASAMNSIGYYYSKGLGGLRENKVEARKWYRKAAEGGNASAMYSIGFYYDVDLGGFLENKEEALKWYRKATEGGNASAMCRIAWFYENGLGGLQKDEVEALKWFRKAADGGEPMSMIWVGQYYENGKGGLRKNQKEAIKWYKLAAKAEDEDISEFAIKRLEKLGQ